MKIGAVTRVLPQLRAPDDFDFVSFVSGLLIHLHDKRHSNIQVTDSHSYPEFSVVFIRLSPCCHD